VLLKFGVDWAVDLRKTLAFKAAGTVFAIEVNVIGDKQQTTGKETKRQ